MKSNPTEFILMPVINSYVYIQIDRKRKKIIIHRVWEDLDVTEKTELYTVKFPTYWNS